jgi:hypothetical protein
MTALTPAERILKSLGIETPEPSEVVEDPLIAVGQSFALPGRHHPVPEVRQVGPAPVGDLAAACLATPSPPDRGLGCGHSRNHRPSFLPDHETDAEDGNGLPRDA